MSYIVQHSPGGAAAPHEVPPEFGAGEFASTDYINKKAGDLLTNGNGAFQNNYNFSGFVYSSDPDPQSAGMLRSGFTHTGPYEKKFSDEFMGVDTTKAYSLKAGMYQTTDAYQYLGLTCFDEDYEKVKSYHHMRFRGNDFGASYDSLTQLSRALSVGDTEVYVDFAAGWNNTISTSTTRRGITMFEYRAASGRRYRHYSRLNDFDIFDLGAISKVVPSDPLSEWKIQLKRPWSLANPSGGAWPVGSYLANSSSGADDKYLNFAGDRTMAAYTATQNWIGGTDYSGSNWANNFPPGTSYVKVSMLANFTSTDPAAQVTFSGMSFERDPNIQMLAASPVSGSDTKALSAREFKYLYRPVIQPNASVTYQQAQKIILDERGDV